MGLGEIFRHNISAPTCTFNLILPPFPPPPPHTPLPRSHPLFACNFNAYYCQIHSRSNKNQFSTGNRLSTTPALAADRRFHVGSALLLPLPSLPPTRRHPRPMCVDRNDLVTLSGYDYVLITASAILANWKGIRFRQCVEDSDEWALERRWAS